MDTLGYERSLSGSKYEGQLAYGSQYRVTGLGKEVGRLSVPGVGVKVVLDQWDSVTVFVGGTGRVIISESESLETSGHS